MTKLEKKLIDAICDHRRLLFVILVGLLGLAIRWAGRYLESEDMHYCLLPWFNQIKEAGGLSALSSQVGNYGLLYQTLISLMTYLPIPAIMQYKILSTVFDAALAFMAAAIYRDVRFNGLSGKGTASPLTPDEKNAVVTQSCVLGGMVWLLPTVILNSSYWAQCDSIYTFFSLATLYFLRRESFVRAFIMLGLAFSFKLQAIFFLPFICVYYLVSKRFSIAYLMISVVVMWLTGIVAFAYGRSLLDPITIYAGQSSHYHYLYLCFANFWVLLGDHYWELRWFAILFTVYVLFNGAFVCVNRKQVFTSSVNYYAIAVWFVWTMLMFLPCMHDRYAYPLDIMLLLMAFLDRRFVKYAVVAVLVSLYLYSDYLFEPRNLIMGSQGMKVVAVIYLLTYIHFSKTLYEDIKNVE